MEPISLAFYATVCGVLSVAAPRLGGIVPRLLIGAIVGVIAALVLPSIRGLITGY
jgi:hypothetical protein